MFKIQFLWSFTRLSVNVSPSQQTFCDIQKQNLQLGWLKLNLALLLDQLRLA